ncbi:hypothetical protein LSAT2_012551, partial [Lamellibrachia satsuma]
ENWTGGVVYVRWGRHSCPNNATLVYSGRTMISKFFLQ